MMNLYPVLFNCVCLYLHKLYTISPLDIGQFDTHGEQEGFNKGTVSISHKLRPVNQSLARAWRIKFDRYSTLT